MDMLCQSFVCLSYIAVVKILTLYVVDDFWFFLVLWNSLHLHICLVQICLLNRALLESIWSFTQSLFNDSLVYFNNILCFSLISTFLLLYIVHWYCLLFLMRLICIPPSVYHLYTFLAPFIGFHFNIESLSLSLDHVAVLL